MQKAKAVKEEATQWVVKMYQDELDRPESSCLGFWAVCKAVEKAVKGESGFEVKIGVEMVRARFNGVWVPLGYQQMLTLFVGGRPIAESNHAKCWLLPEEEEVVLEFALEIAL